MAKITVEIPTYDPESEVEYDYERPHALTLREEDGLRVFMGDPSDANSPDVIIERAVGLWRVFIHADRTDPLCVIEIREDRASVEDYRGRVLLERTLG
ncbi:MAG: hypothetical protein DCC68_05740 [Planctomycetota bacterium]|nr:MAG: hypothetical protein DCC68_05740 [Planctomycetota bacterium]